MAGCANDQGKAPTDVADVQVDNKATKEQQQQEEQPSAWSSLRLDVMLVLVLIASSMVIIVVYKALIEMVTSEWSCGGGTWGMDFPWNQQEGAVSNVTYAIDAGLTDQAEYTILTMVHTLIQTSMGFPVPPMLFLAMYGWQTARGTIAIAILVWIPWYVGANFFYDSPGVSATGVSSLAGSLNWLGCSGLTAWKTRNWRLILLAVAALLMATITSVVPGMLFVPAFKRDSPPRVLIRSVIGLGFGGAFQVISDGVMNWGTRGEKPVQSVLFGNLLLALTVFLLRLLQASITDLMQAVVVEVGVQLTQLACAVANIEFGGVFAVVLHIVRRLRRREAQEPFWVTDPGLAQAHAVALGFKELLEMHSIVAATFLALMIPFSFIGERRVPFTTIMNGLIQLAGEVAALCTVHAYQRWRLRSGANVFDTQKTWAQIRIADKIPLFMIIFLYSGMMPWVIGMQLCWSCGGTWVPCDTSV